MPMDTLFWTKLNPDIAFKKVTRRYYNQYYYKLEINAVCASFLRNPDQTLQTQAINMSHRRSQNFGGSWRVRNQQLPNADDLRFLALMGELIHKFNDRIKVRIEDPYMQIYAETESELLTFVSNIDYEFHKNIKTIYGPGTVDEFDLLTKGYTIRAEPQEYGYRVSVKEGRYSRETKQQILGYLRNIGDEAKLPRHFVENMDRSFDSVWNCYFYVKDPGVLTMLRLISPSFIGRVEEFCVSPK